MAATLYAKSIFGEDALANLSIEKPMDNPSAPVTGHIRIRAKSQGMALSLGDKINLSQKRSLTQSSQSNRNPEKKEPKEVHTEEGDDDGH